jgi:hypothetical protein
MARCKLPLTHPTPKGTMKSIDVYGWRRPNEFICTGQTGGMFRNDTVRRRSVGGVIGKTNTRKIATIAGAAA